MPRKADTVRVFTTEIDGANDRVVIPLGGIPPVYDGWTLTYETHPTPDGRYVVDVYATPPDPTVPTMAFVPMSDRRVPSSWISNGNGYRRPAAFDDSLPKSEPMQAQLRKQRVKRAQTAMLDIMAKIEILNILSEELCHT